MIEIPQQAYIKANELLDKIPLSYSKLKDIPANRGVYLIYKIDKGVIYVGESRNLKSRILGSHISGELEISTSIFREKLTREPYNLKTENQQLLNWIKENCEFSYTEIDDSDLCHFVEKAAILHLRKKGEPLLND